MTIEYDMPEHTPQIVMNGHFYLNQPWKIHLSSSSGVLDSFEHSEVIKNAHAYILTSSNDTIQLLYDSLSKYYKSEQNPPQSTEKYQIFVSAPNYESIQAEDILPEKIQASVKRVEKTTNKENEEIQKVDIEIKDDRTNENYYYMLLLSAYEDRYYHHNGDSLVFFTSSHYNDSEFRTYDEVIKSDSPEVIRDGFYENKYAVFSDILFNGKSHTFTLEVYSGSYALVVGSISKNTYLYLQSYYRNINSDGVFSEPTQLHSNIQNGLGIFAAFNIDTLKF
jgi:hypothetical protein